MDVKPVLKAVCRDDTVQLNGVEAQKKNDGFQKYKNKTVGLTGEKGCVL